MLFQHPKTKKAQQYSRRKERKASVFAQVMRESEGEVGRTTMVKG